MHLQVPPSQIVHLFPPVRLVGVMKQTIALLYALDTPVTCHTHLTPILCPSSPVLSPCCCCLAPGVSPSRLTCGHGRPSGSGCPASGSPNVYTGSLRRETWPGGVQVLKLIARCMGTINARRCRLVFMDIADVRNWSEELKLRVVNAVSCFILSHSTVFFCFVNR